MATAHADVAGRSAPSWFAGEINPDVSDQQLLDRFVAHRDETAFVGLVHRHSRTVWGVCRRVLRQEQDAEDAFQAVFLVLARSAASIRKGTALGSWLYAVAFRTALRARQNEAKRSAGEKKATARADGPSPSSEAACLELQRKLDEEVLRLAEKYRAPFILCCLEGMSKAEAARELGWKEGTVSGRLARARKLLQTRLARRGFTLSAILTAAVLGQNLASANPAPALVQAATDGALQPGTLSPTVQDLADGALRDLPGTNLVPALMAVATVFLLLVGAVLSAFFLTSTHADPPVVVEPDTFLPPPVALGTPVDEQVLAVAFSPDGKRLVTAGGQGKIPGQAKIWDVASGQELHAAGLNHGARSVAFAPDGRTFATGDYRGSIILHDADTGDERVATPAHAGGVAGVAFSNDGVFLASAGADRTAKIWRTTGLREHKVLRGHADKVLAVAFFRDGQSVVTGGQDSTAKIWDIETATARFTLEGHQAAIEAVAVSPDDSLVATASWDKTVRLWDAGTGAELAVFEGAKPQAFYGVAFSPDGVFLAAAGRDGTICLWNARTHQPVRTLEKHAAPIWSLAFSRDGVLASGSADRTAKLWHVGVGKQLKELSTSWSGTRPIRAVTYAPGGSVVAVATNDRTVHIRDAKTGDVLKVLHGHSAQVNCLAFSPDGARLASGSDDHGIKLWDWSAGEETSTLAGHAGPVHALVFTPTGKQLVSAGDDKIIRVWDVAAAKEAFALPGHEGAIRALALSSDGRTLASGGADRAIRIWDVGQRMETRSLQGHDGAVRALAFSRTGLLASASEDRTVKLWDLSDGVCRHTLEGHTSGVWALAFSPLGTTLVSAGQDATVRVWDPAAGQARGVLRGHKDHVTALTIHPLGLNLVSGSHDTVLLRWQAGKFSGANRQAAPGDPQKGAARVTLTAQQTDKVPADAAPAPLLVEPLKAEQGVRAEGTAPRTASRGWLIAALLVGIALALCFALTFALRIFLQQRQAAAPLQEAAPPTPALNRRS